jgi:hypothetical protein
MNFNQWLSFALPAEYNHFATSLHLLMLKNSNQPSKMKRVSALLVKLTPLILPSKPPPHLCLLISVVVPLTLRRTAGGRKGLLREPRTKMLPGKLGGVVAKVNKC